MKRNIRRCIFMVITAVFLPLNPPTHAQTPDGMNWVKFNSNPILVRKSGTWYTNNIGRLTVLSQNGIYKMWSAGLAGGNNIGYLTSSDGINWTDHGQVFNVAQGAAWPMVIFDEGIFKMFYDRIIHAPFPDEHVVGYAISSDGILWTDHGTVLSLRPNFNIISRKVIRDGSILKMWMHIVDPFNTLQGFFGYATSSDGISWTYHGSVLQHGASNEFDAAISGLEEIIKDNGTYKMWYSATGVDFRTHQMAYATSLDGINWNKHGLVLERVPGSPFEDAIGGGQSTILFGNPTKWWYNNAGSGFDWSISYATSESPSNDVKDFVFLAEERIVIQGQAVSEGDIHSNDYIHFDRGLPSTHDGNVTAVGNIKISRDNTIEGDVKAGGNIDNFGTINGVAMENDPSVVAIPITSLPTFSAGTNNVTIAKGTTVSLPPDSYGIVNVQKNATLQLAHDGGTGDYFFKSLELNENAVLDIDVSSGLVKINVTNRIKFIKNVEVEITPAEDTEKVFFNNTNTATIKIGSGSKVFGNIVAPDALVELKKNSGFKGAICANVIKVNVGATFLHHNSSMSLPKASAVSEEDNDESSVETTSIPKEFELVQNYPNPFNPSTTITFAVPKAGEVKLSVYNLKGQLVRTLVSGPAAAGWHKVVWDGTNQQENQVASGIYVYSLESKDFRAHRKLVLAR